MKIIDKRLDSKEVPFSKVCEGEVFEFRFLSGNPSIYLKTNRRADDGTSICVSLISGFIYNLKKDDMVKPLDVQLVVSAKSDIE